MSAPTLLSLTLTDTVDLAVSPTLRIDADARDSDGIAYVQITWTSALNYRDAVGFTEYAHYSYMYGGAGWSGGSRTGSLTLQKINEPGVYTVHSVAVADVNNNVTSYTQAELSALGFDTSFTLVGAVPDRGLPVLDSLDIPAFIDTAHGPVRWTMRSGASDALSDLRSVTVDFARPLKVGYDVARPSADGYYDFTQFAMWGSAAEFADGTARTTSWVAAPNGVYDIRGVAVADKAGNQRYYEASELHKMGIATQVTVSDGSYVAPRLATSARTEPAVAGDAGAIVIKVASDALKAGANTIEFSIGYNASTARFDGWGGAGRGDFSASYDTIELGSYGLTTIRATIDGAAQGSAIELHFTPLAANGSFAYDITAIRINGETALASFDQQFSYRIQSRRDGSAGDDLLTGDSRDEVFHAGAGDDLIVPMGGRDEVHGGAGTDTAQYAYARSMYKVERSGGELVVSNLAASNDVDRLDAIELLQFADQTVAFDPNGDAAQIYRLYKAAFDRAPDAAGFGFWVHARESGVSLHDIADGFVGSAEFARLYGANPSNAAIVKGLYANVLDRLPDAAGNAFWLNALDNKVADVANVLLGFSESAENQAGTAELIGQGMAYIPYA